MDSWITVSPMSGEGNGSLKVTAQQHTGRTNRTGTFTVTPDHLTTAKKTVTVNQTANNASFHKTTPTTDTSSIAATATGNARRVTLIGTGNAKSIRVRVADTTKRVTCSLKVNETAVTLDSNGFGIPSGDPGAARIYPWEAVFDFTNSPHMASDKQVLCYVEGFDGADGSITNVIHKVTLGATAATLTVSPTSTTAIAAAGGNTTVTVTSNDSWKVA